MTNLENKQSWELDPFGVLFIKVVDLPLGSVPSYCLPVIAFLVSEVWVCTTITNVCIWQRPWHLLHLWVQARQFWITRLDYGLALWRDGQLQKIISSTQLSSKKVFFTKLPQTEQLFLFLEALRLHALAPLQRSKTILFYPEKTLLTVGSSNQMVMQLTSKVSFSHHLGARLSTSERLSV